MLQQCMSAIFFLFLTVFHMLYTKKGDDIDVVTFIYNI